MKPLPLLHVLKLSQTNTGSALTRSLKTVNAHCYPSLIVDIYLLDQHFLRTNTCWSTQNTHLKVKTKNLITGSLHSPGTHANSKAINGLPVNDELIHAER